MSSGLFDLNEKKTNKTKQKKLNYTTLLNKKNWWNYYCSIDHFILHKSYWISECHFIQHISFLFIMMHIHTFCHDSIDKSPVLPTVLARTLTKRQEVMFKYFLNWNCGVCPICVSLLEPFFW